MYNIIYINNIYYENTIVLGFLIFDLILLFAWQNYNTIIFA